jgi:hypothetical protein
MGYIDQTEYRLTCTSCNISETSKVLERGSAYGSSWQEGTSFSRFETKWSGGGSQEPTLTLAVCKACGEKAKVESGYSL